MNKMKQILNTGVFTATEGFFLKKRPYIFHLLFFNLSI